MDRDAIERRDFPTGRRGYEPEAVDAHLRRVADEIEALRERADAPPPRARGLSAGASDRVREILEAAEHSAAEIRDTAGRDASDHVARVSEAAAAMMSRLDQLQRELDGLMDGLRRSGAVLEDGLARLRDDVREMEGDEDPHEPDELAEPPALADAPVPAVVDPPEPDAIPEPPIAPAAPEDDAGGEGDEAGARLTALNMALGGTPRDETARFLAEHYELRDPEGLLDDVYSRAGPPAT